MTQFMHERILIKFSDCVLTLSYLFSDNPDVPFRISFQLNSKRSTEIEIFYAYRSFKENN